MPELPDVAVFKQYIDSTALHQRIERAEVKDADLLKGVSASRFRGALKGRRFESTCRHGKYLFVELNDDGWLVLHFGMTGEPKYYKDPDQTPPHARVVFHFDNGYRLAYDCQRKLGRVSLTDDPAEYIRGAELGPDALAEEVGFERFREMLENRRGSIKSTLMTQEMMAGVGNIYSDEILFHARVHPKTSVEELDEKSLRSIYRAMNKVLQTAIERKADVEQFPRSWLLPNRDGKCPRCGTPVKTAKVSGRTAHFCPQCQRLR